MIQIIISFIGIHLLTASLLGIVVVDYLIETGRMNYVRRFRSSDEEAWYYTAAVILLFLALLGQVIFITSAADLMHLLNQPTARDNFLAFISACGLLAWILFIFTAPMFHYKRLVKLKE